MKLFARLDHYFIPSTITRLWRRRETARVERFIIETLQDCGADDLNMILRRVKLGLLVYKLKDSEPMKSWADYAASFLFSPSTKGARTELVDLLAVQRVADLNVRSECTARRITTDASISVSETRRALGAQRHALDQRR